MTTKTLVAALALTLAPTLTLAMGTCNWSKQQQAQSCATGSVYDAESGKCVQANA